MPSLRIAQQQVNIQQTVQRIADSYYKPQFYLGVEEVTHRRDTTSTPILTLTTQFTLSIGSNI